MYVCLYVSIEKKKRMYLCINREKKKCVCMYLCMLSMYVCMYVCLYGNPNLDQPSDSPTYMGSLTEPSTLMLSEEALELDARNEERAALSVGRLGLPSCNRDRRPVTFTESIFFKSAAAFRYS